MSEGFNWFLILVACIVGLLVLAANVYVLIHYQHPEDENQAWVPKIIVVFGFSLAMITVLMFPLDVANRAACDKNLVETACRFTLPMKELWYTVFITNLVMVFIIIPFTMFFYEADSDYSWFEKVKTAFLWTLATLFVLALVIGILYGLWGYVEFPTQQLTSGIFPIDYLGNLTSYNTTCIKTGEGMTGEFYINTTRLKDRLCDAFGGTYETYKWKVRVSLPVYVIALQSIAGWILFMVFAGVGVLCAPIDWIFQYMSRPRAVITKSEYIQRARAIAQRAKEIRRMADLLKKQEKDNGKDRRWRGNLRRLQRELVTLEDDEYHLDAVFPQGQDGEVRWVTYQLGFILLLLLGVIGLGISLMWMVHIVLYMLPITPVNPLLNDLFIALDDVFPLFGVAAFAGFCAYLMIVAMKGNFLLGLNFLFISLYPMKVGATMMSSFLVNEAIILLMSTAVIQFCAQAFAVYGNSTMIFDIFGNQVLYLKGIKWVYHWNVFLYIFLIIMAVSTTYMAVVGPGKWKGRKKKEDAYMY